jgi:dihydrodipicolinate synthase/N-acetylneuraminate lyase
MAELMAPLNRLMFVESNPIPVKYALARMHLIVNELRLPLVPLNQPHEDAVQAEVEAVLAVELKLRENQSLAQTKRASKFDQRCNVRPQ